MPSSHFIAFKFGALTLAVVLGGCSAFGDFASNTSDLGAEVSLSGDENGGDPFLAIAEDELKDAALQLRASEDQKLGATKGSNYAWRLTRLTRKHVSEDGLKLNFKVYLSPVANITSTPDGSIRIYRGLIDMMNDQELLSMIGHEIGHIKLGHSTARMRTAYGEMAQCRAAATSSPGDEKVLEAPDLDAMGRALINSGFSQSEETAADDYGVAFMKKHNYRIRGMKTALRKMAAMSGKKMRTLDRMLSAHPEPGQRLGHMR